MANAVSRRAAPRLPDQVTLVHGPHDILGRYILIADKAARDRGVFLSLETDFHEFLRVNEENHAHWHPLPPNIDPRFNELGPENSFWIRGRNAAGESVLTGAVRLYRFTETSLKEELESLRLFYRYPMAQQCPGERCVVTAPSAQRLVGQVLYSGGVWFRPDFRGLGLASIVPRLARTIALSRWNTDYAFSLVGRKLVEKGVSRSYGFRNIEFSVDWYDSIYGAHFPLALVWIDRDDFIFDLETTLVLQPPSQPQRRTA